MRAGARERPSVYELDVCMDEGRMKAKKTEHLFDHEAKKLAFVMQVHELDYVFDSPHLRNAFDPHLNRIRAKRVGLAQYNKNNTMRAREGNATWNNQKMKINAGVMMSLTR